MENKDHRAWEPNLEAGFKGDKVILVTALLLMMSSVISIFGSTSLLALEKGVERESIMLSQLLVVSAGFGIIFLLYAFGRSGLYEFVGKLGFALSLAMLLILVLQINLGFIRAGNINGAWRVIVVFGFQLHVYELVKLLMILYVSWALKTYKEDGFKLTGWLAARFPRLSFLDTALGEKCFYIYVPVLVTVALVILGSTSSALFMAGVLVFLFIVGGVDLRDIGVQGMSLVAVIGLLWCANALRLIEINRFDTAESRILHDEKAQLDTLVKYRPGGGSYNETKYIRARDRLIQPVGAQLAIKEGGLFGKGIGKSTQKYVVPVIFGDYMFSFIIEETGLAGAALLLILYYSLLARGVNMSRYCDNYFDKMVIAGFSLLFTGQAFMHMMVNVHFPLIPQTGQTLPLISHGTTSFLVFSAVIGVLLSLSREPVQKKKDIFESAEDGHE